MSFLEFKNKFINDAIKSNFCINRQELKNSLDRIPSRLKDMEDDRLIMIRDMSCDETIGLNYVSDNISCKYDFHENSLLVALVAPDWEKGWRNISSDKHISDTIENYMFSSNQYVYRSYMINIIGALALTYGISSSFMGRTMFRYGHYNIIDDYQEFIDEIKIRKHNTNVNEKVFSYIMRKINALDPYVNRAIFYYSKSLSLLTNLYEEEAIISLDNCIDIIVQFIKKRKKMPTTKRKDMHQILKNILKINNTTAEYLDYIYDLRCGFAAHPARNLWWDFSEIHMYNYESIIENVRITLIKFLEYENKERIVIKNPIYWYEWFMGNCDLIYDYIF